MWMAQERAKMAHVFYIPQTEVEPETVKVYRGERALSMQLAVCKTPQQSGEPSHVDGSGKSKDGSCVLHSSNRSGTRDCKSI